MIGPLMLGAMFSSIGIQMGVAITGGMFLVATVLFVLLTGGLRPNKTQDGGGPQPAE
jgi:hypothetical protein